MDRDEDRISLLVVAVESLKATHEKTIDKVDLLVISMGKQEVILEKLANIEARQAESSRQIHHRINQREEEIEKIKEDGCHYGHSYVNRREVELKRYENIIDDFEIRITSNSKLLAEIKDIPNKIVMRVLMIAISALTAGAIGLWVFGKV